MKKFIITALTFILFFLAYTSNAPKRKTYCTNLDAELMKEIRVLSAQQVKRQNDLLEEAIKDLLKKYQHLEPSLGVSMVE
jgi:flagellar biosynthesis chaperone FliJ